MDCGYVPTPQNGTKFGEETTYPNSIELSCDEGFVISGSTVRSCLTNGTWSGQQTRCKGNMSLRTSWKQNTHDLMFGFRSVKRLEVDGWTFFALSLVLRLGCISHITPTVLRSLMQLRGEWGMLCVEGTTRRGSRVYQFYYCQVLPSLNKVLLAYLLT